MKDLKKLLKKMGIDVSCFSSSWNVLLPIIYYIYYNPDYDKNIDSIRAYLLRAIFFTYFQSGTTSKLQQMKSNINSFDYEITIEMLDQMNDLRVTIWASDSAHEQTGLRFVVYLLKERNIDMIVINTTEEYEKLFRVKMVKYTVLHTGEIPPEKLQHMYEHGSGKGRTIKKLNIVEERKDKNQEKKKQVPIISQTFNFYKSLVI